jgi:hypothetical protein
MPWVIRGHHRPFAGAVDQRPAGSGLQIVVIVTQPVELAQPGVSGLRPGCGGRYAATSATTRRAGAANPYGAGAIELNAIANGGLMRMLFGDVFDTDAVAPVSCLLNDCSCPVLSPTPERSNKRVSAPGALPPALLVQRHRWRALQSSSRSEAQITSDQPAACTCRSSNHPGAPDSRRGR